MRATSVAWFAVLIAFSARSASAQDSDAGNNISVRLVKVGDDDFVDKNSASPITPIGDAACQAGTITVSLAALPSADEYPVIEAWLATGLGMCADPDRNARVVGASNCTQIPLEDDGRMIARPSATLKVPITDSLCANEGSQSIYFLAMKSAHSAETAQYYGVLTFRLDRTPPSAPTNLKSGSGEDMIELTWDVPEGAKRFWLLVDTTTKPADPSTAICSSAFLHDSGEFDPNDAAAIAALPTGVFVVSADQEISSYTFDSHHDFMGSQFAAVSVIAGDVANNPSKMSNIVCLDVVKSEGSLGTPGHTESDHGCSMTRVRSASLGGFSINLALLGVWALRRRRQRLRRTPNFPGVST